LLVDLVSFLHSDSLLFLGRKTTLGHYDRGRVATFYELTGILVTGTSMAGTSIQRSNIHYFRPVSRARRALAKLARIDPAQPRTHPVEPAFDIEQSIYLQWYG
jgi:hypothetical protein